jgi:hypothetical protein
MFQICVPDQKVKRKKTNGTLLIFLKMKWLGTSKYTIFLIFLRFQNLWNLINALKNKLWKCSFKCFLWIFKVGPRKSSCDVVSGTTQGQDCPNVRP